LASQGNEVALFHALLTTWTVDHLIVSPRLRGSNPYPYGSLTYRYCKNSIYLRSGFVNSFFGPDFLKIAAKTLKMLKNKVLKLLKM